MLKSQRRSRLKFLQWRWAKRSVLFVVSTVLLSAMLGLMGITGVSGMQTPLPGEPSPSQSPQSPSQSPSAAEVDRFLPPPRVHVLPASLAQWQVSEQANGSQGDNFGDNFNDNVDKDYFDQVQPTIAGYLIWSQFPVRIYLEPAPSTSNPVPEALRNRSQEWVTAVTAAIRDWNAYLPLAIVDSPDAADITIWRRTPPLQVNRSAGTARQPELRARSAETRFTFFVNRSVPGAPVLSHRMTIWLGTGQTQGYLRAAARHELGHALGIWGHSPNTTDVMYFSQVRQSPPISDRDIHTLKRIYQQPTRLGWSIPRSLN